jgi:hypothetical protein
VAGKAPVIGVWDALILGIPPVLAAGFLGWITYKVAAESARVGDLIPRGVAVLGVLLMFAARYILKSPFFHIQRESDGQGTDHQHVGSHRR